MAEKLKNVKLEEKVLEFDFEISQAQFNKSDSYFLRISVRNSHRYDLLPQVLLDTNNSGYPTTGHTAETDLVVWDSTQQYVTFQKNRFRFRLPRGFCKNDKNYDVHLKIEAYSKRRTEHVGEALFAIYPRTEAPKANFSVKKGKDFYRYASVLTLLRPASRASISMHCGRLSYAVALREFVQVIASESSEDEEVPPSPIVSPPLPPAPPPIPPPSAIPTPQPAAGNQPTKLSSATAKRRTVLISENGSRHSDDVRRMHRINEEETFRSEKTVRSVDTSTQTDSFIAPTRAPALPVTYEHDAIDDVIAKYVTEDSFHISVTSSPLPPLDYSNQKTMDQPTDDNPALPGRLNAKAGTITEPRTPYSPSHGPVNRHVAKPGHVAVYVIVHGATSLPSRSDGSDPIPFATVKSGFDEKGGRPAQAATHASLAPTHCPSWEESMLVQVSDSDEEEEIILTVADKMNKEKLVSFRLPLSYLVPFHSYHLELVQPTSAIPSGIRLYVTIQKRLSHLRRLQGFSFCGLEVTIGGFHRDLSNPVGPLTCVTRIVPDYSRYRDDVLSKRQAGITTTSVTFPSPNPASFQVVKQHQGHPQISTPSHGDSRPEWMESLLFTGEDTATMFSYNSALVLELYPASTSMSSVTWTIRNPIGFCTFLLTDEVFRTLTSDAGSMGMRVDDVMVQGTSLRTVEGPYPSIGLAIRLITTERPDSLVVTSDITRLPSIDDAPMPRDTPPPTQATLSDVAPLESHATAIGGPPFERKKTRVLVQEDEYPPSDVFESILPDYVISANDTGPGISGVKSAKTDRQAEMPQLNNEKSLLDHQTNELTKYREAVKRMSRDMVAMKQTISQLQEENARLRSQLIRTKEVGRSVMDDIHKGVVSSVEVADKFVAVTQKLSKESEDLKKYKGRVQHLQNEMIKANEREKAYLTESMTHKEQEDTIERLKEREKKGRLLQETCLQQEKVIKKMESLLSKYMKSSKPQDATNTQDQQNAMTMLSEENAKLQIELERKRASQEMHEEDVIEMKIRLERAESRVRTLEDQLEHNARTWAREKHELTVRLQEHRNGIVRTSDPLM